MQMILICIDNALSRLGINANVLSYNRHIYVNLLSCTVVRIHTALIFD